MLTSAASVLLVFGLLGGLLWLLKRCSASTVRGRHIEVVDSVPLPAGKSLSLVKVAGRAMLLGVSNEAVSLIVELNAGELDGREEESDGAPSIRPLLTSWRQLGRAFPARSRDM